MKQENIKEKLALKNYIILQLGRTNKKNYENYCITRIYHLLNRSDIQFITQQMLKRNNSKIALADLYLPQLDVWVEIDEGHHLNQEEEDEKRTNEVLIIENKKKHFEEIIHVKNKPYRIKITNKTLEEINEQIDTIVHNIKNKIRNLEDQKLFTPWKALYEKPSYYIKKGYLKLSDRQAFRTIQEVSELFNKGYKGTQRAWFKDKPNSKITVWCPKLKFEKSDKGEFDNFISPDGKTIYESKSTNEFNYKEFIDKYNEGYTTRYVFAKFKDSSGRNMYRFRGVFELDLKQTKDLKKVVWRRIGEQINLSEYF